MLLEGIGIVMILTATTSTGAWVVAKEKRRLRELEQMERAIVLMRNQISYLGISLQEVLSQIAWQMEGMIGSILDEIRGALERREGASVEEIWGRVWQKEGRRTYLTEVDLKEIELFGNTLGILERNQQEGSMELLLLYIRQTQERLRKRLDKNGKLYYSMGVISGLMLSVILL